MNPIPPEPTRWRDRAEGGGDVADRAGRLVRAVPEPVALSDAALTRIHAAVSARRPERRGALLPVRFVPHFAFGQARLQSTSRYAHLDDGHVLDASERIGQLIAEALGEPIH